MLLPAALYFWQLPHFMALKYMRRDDYAAGGGNKIWIWFCIESTLLALVIAGTALSFYLNCTTKDASRMFHASHLYLPVFISGLMFHRISNNEHTISAKNLENILERLKVQTGRRS